MTINEVDLDNQRIYIKTEAVMKRRVAKSTRERYKISNITFILWLFGQHNKYPSLLQTTLYYIMQTKNLEDIYWIKTRGKQSKLRHGIRSVYCEALRTIKPYVQSLIPVKLEHLTFTIFYRVLAQSIKSWKIVIQEQVTGNNQAVEVWLSSSTYEGACSELLNLYHDSGKNKEATYPQLWPKFSLYTKLSRRIAASDKHYIGLKLI